MKIILIALTSMAVIGCSNTYEVKQEANMKDNRLLNEVPQWYIDASIDEGILFDRDAEKLLRKLKTQLLMLLQRLWFKVMNNGKRQYMKHH